MSLKIFCTSDLHLGMKFANYPDHIRESLVEARFKTLESLVEKANREKCDLFIVVGSSLVVSPAADMPLEALRAGARLAIINLGETPFDGHVHLRFNEKIDQVLPAAVRELKKRMGFTGSD